MSPPTLAPDRTAKPPKPASLLSVDGIFATLTRKRDQQRALLGRHKRTVAIFKFLLPALAAVLITALAVFPNLRDGASFGRISYKKQTNAATSLSRMSIAQYRGIDAKGEKFTLTASRAVQISKNRLTLIGPKGDLTTVAGNWLMLAARHGLYRQNTQHLDLAGKVTLYRQDGTTLHTSTASIDIAGGTAAGSQPVKAFGPFGTLHAKDGFIATNHGTDILFKGKSHLMLDQVMVPTIVANNHS